ncbi:DNA-protecting protein DprA [Lichenicoccus roseus]|uniref:DNA-protecting protein DprA n=2 Tax=Lichenicoccus roseus TaxID=2683649 RepID=A0A5R9JDK8_9PROT|nr:DNA-processing protein DprA [Lichenicoccus roseus]TLU74637.1 DNA-protecting protein DprA [Lichenicoccus roseus]
MTRYGDAEAALAALPALARNGGGARAPVVPSVQAIADEIGALQALGARLLVLGEPDYPPLLAQLADAPPVLAVLGDIAVLHRRLVAIVGSRNASSNGLRIAEALAAELGDHGLVVVSGLARGIDTAAHRGAMFVGPTIACVAGGLDQPYPPENALLQAQIAQRGAVVAEAPLGTAPQSRHFPRRNRIIAGLSLGCVVVEAAPRSGSLITADLAHTYGRELFAVPGSPLDPRCRGANNLIRQGHAHLTESAIDVLSQLPALSPQQMRGLGPDGFAERPQLAFSGWDGMGGDPWPELDRVRPELLGLLGPDPVAVDDLIRRCQFSVGAVLAVLTELELGGRVESLPGNRVSLLGSPP